MPKFTSQEDVVRWLNTQSLGIAQVFAARAALRALPVLARTLRLYGDEIRSAEHRDFALRTFRYLQLAWAFSAYPGHQSELARTAGSAAELSGSYDAPDLVRSAASAAFAITGKIAAPVRAAIFLAIEAVSFSKKSFDDMLKACSADAELLDQRTSPVTLVNQQLWPRRPPDWVADAWDELKHALLADGKHWIVWTDWYEDRLNGRPGNQKLEIARASIPNQTWEQAPAPVNAHIQELLSQHGISLYEVTSAPELVRRVAALTWEELAIIGVRVALRVAVPSIESNDPDLMLALRSISSAWTAARYELPSDHLTHALHVYNGLIRSPGRVAEHIHKILLASVSKPQLAAALPSVIRGIDAFRAITRDNYGEAAEEAFDLCLAQDLDVLRGAYAAVVAHEPVWLEHAPPLWAMQQWGTLKQRLLNASNDWLIWVDWYEHRITGIARSKAVELAYVEVPDELWSQGPAAVNEWIKRRIDELEAPITPPDATSPALVPPQQPAAIEPVWGDGKLTLPNKAAKTNLDGRKFSAALKSLREALSVFADDIACEANIDKRIVARVRKLADQVPKRPNQTELFRLGHASVVFAAYAKTADAEWPDYLAAQYHAVVLHFERTILQSPLWREFIQNAHKQVLTEEQTTNSYQLATDIASALRMEEADDFIDPSLPQALDELAGPLRTRIPVGNESPFDVIEAGYDLLAYDVIESVNNILKRIAEAALKAKANAGAAAHGVGSTLGEAGQIWAEGIGDGLKQAAKKDGPKTGEELFKWLKRVVVGGVILKGSAFTLSSLLAMYPQAFAWLQPLLRLLL